MKVVFTIGHGARSAEEFSSLLTDARIELLVDVRRYPGSRRHPHFSREALAKDLATRAIGYEWWGESLGGRRKSDELPDRHIAWRNTSFRAYASHMETEQFREAFAALKESSLTARLAIMCAETLWWRCHRRLLADALVVNGFEVIHLGLGSDKPHALTETARVTDEGGLVYDVDPGNEGVNGVADSADG